MRLADRCAPENGVVRRLPAHDWLVDVWLARLLISLNDEQVELH
jgi:hypothetical protein